MKTTDSIGRRSFVRGTVLALAAGAIPATAAASTVSALPGLIAKHRDAEAAYLTAVEAKEAAEDAITYKPAYVPLMITSDGKHHGHLELKREGEEYVERELRHHHEALRRSLCSAAAKALSVDHCAEVERGIDASLTACLQQMQVAVEGFHQQEDAAGLTAAQQQLDDAFAEVDRLCVAILGHEPTSPADAQLKADWIAAEHKSRGGYFNDDEMAALVASIAGKAVA